MRASGFAPPFVWVERLGRNALAVPTTQGPVPVICSNWFPVDPKTQKTSVIAVHLYSDRGVHLAVPEQSPTMRLSKVRATNRPEEFLLVEWKGALTTIDGGKSVRLCDVGPV